jgi:hypothetical protein
VLNWRADCDSRVQVAPRGPRPRAPPTAVGSRRGRARPELHGQIERPPGRGPGCGAPLISAAGRPVAGDYVPPDE